MKVTRYNLLIALIMVGALALSIGIFGIPDFTRPAGKPQPLPPTAITQFPRDPGTPGASDFIPKAPPSFLTDGTPEPYGSAEGNADTFIFISRPNALRIRAIELSNFAPNDLQHVRDLAVVAANASTDGGAPQWQIIPARLSSKGDYDTKLTVPKTADRGIITLELKPEYAGGEKFNTYGIAVLSGSEGFKRNYLSVGNGVYIREMRLVEVSTP
ncbi:MAG: hypothetical protein ACYC1L_11060 [Alphaproteobacteria bacterium]